MTTKRNGAMSRQPLNFIGKKIDMNNATNDLQFYPTPPSLARKAWAAFENRRFARVLDPSAGNGGLVCDDVRSHLHPENIDCIEIDPARHVELHQQSLNIVGSDFLQFRDGAIYSHIIMNPPFNNGVHHVLHAWNILWEGEIVAILNAETIRNPFSKEREFLANLIKDHGSVVEFLDGAFMTDDTTRKTGVEVALVHLKKDAACDSAWLDKLLGRLDVAPPTFVATPILAGELALPSSFVENQCRNYRTAVALLTEAYKIQSRAASYILRLGEEIVEGEFTESGAPKVKDSGRSFGNEFSFDLRKATASLRSRAWHTVLNSTHTMKRLPSKVQTQIHFQFKVIQNLDFTEANVRGFLQGFAESGYDLQMDALCDIFDIVTKYHSDNRVYFKGWKSNDRHQTCGYRIKTTRFILPNFSTGFGSIRYEALNGLSDIDKVFAALDGKESPNVGLRDLFDARGTLTELKCGERLATDYFDVRYYQGIGTVHFFPKRKDLIDRLNRIVGARRQWLPNEPSEASPQFWAEYEHAERCDKAVQAKLPSNKWGWLSAEGQLEDDALACVFRAIGAAFTENPVKIKNLEAPAAPSPALLFYSEEPELMAG